MIIDGIVKSLQSTGGVSVYFNEIVSRLSKSINISYLDYTNGSNLLSDSHRLNICSQKSRLFERYRDVDISNFSSASNTHNVFHSTYYRIPKERDSIPVVTTVHDFTYEKFVSGPALWVHSWQKNRAILNSDLIICVSENTALDLMQYCPIDESKIRVIHNGVAEHYRPITGMMCEASNVVLFVGARGGYKNFHLAVQALARLPHLVLHIVGGGPLTKMEKELLERNISRRYQWLGRLSDETLNEEYNKAYALLYPSSYEGFGIPVIEAMRAGCPVIAVNSSSIPEVAGQAAILVDKISESSLCEALLSVPSQRQHLIDAGFVQAAKFSWEKCYQDTLSVYNELF